MADTTVMIGEPEPIMISLLGDEPSCNGGMDGSIITTVTGGSPPYNYEWDIPAFTADVTVGAGEYTLTVRDAAMCEQSQSIQITEPAPGNTTAVGTDASCHYTTDGSAAIDLVGIGPYTFLWDDPDMQTTQTAINLAPGVYNFTLTDNNGCNYIGFVGIGAPSEVQSSTTTQITTCFGGSDGTALVDVIGGVSPYDFQWNDPAMQTTQQAIGLMAGDYEVIITDGRGCTSVQEATVGSATEITATVDSTFASCLENTDGSATVFPIGGTGTYSFEWDDDLGQTTSTANDLGVGIYTVTITDTNNCSVTDMVEVIAGDPVRIDSIVGTMPSCFGEADGEVVGFISGGEAPYNYRWSDDFMQFFNPAQNLTAGDYTLTVTDDNGCTAVRSVILNEPDLLEIELSAQQIDCFGAENGIITAEVVGGTYPYRYSLDGSAVTDSILGNLDVGMYTVEVTDRNDCVADAQIEITQPAEALNITLMQVDTSCFGVGMGSVSAVATGGTGPDYTFNWSAPGDSDFISNLDSGLLFVTVTDENLCILSDTINVQEYDSLALSLIFAEPACFGFSDGLVAVNTVEGGAGQGIIENYTYAWEGFPNETSNILNNVLGDNNYTVTVTDGQGCRTVDSIFLTQPQQIALTIDKQNPSCFGEMDGFVHITSVQGDHDVASYAWSNPPGATGSDIDNLGDGNYIVSVTDDAGCEINASINLNEPDLLTLELEVTNNICDGNMDGEIVATPIGGTPPYSFEWNNTATSQVVRDLADGEYIVTVIDANGCTEIDSVTLMAPPALMIQANVENITCFEGSDGGFVLNVTGGSEPYEYSYDGSIFNSQNIRSGLSTGSYPVTVVDALGCEWDSLIQIGTVPQFQIFAGEDQFIDIGDSTSLDVTLFNEVGTPEIIWSSLTDFDLSCTECSMTTVSPIFTSTYEVYGIDENGCDANDFVTVFVSKDAEVMVPTGFTPNGDSNNDLLVVHGKSKNIVGINSFTIYDRWGEAVYDRSNFDINDRSIGWDGTYRGQEMEAGVYIWTLQVSFEDGTTDNFQGSTTLIR